MREKVRFKKKKSSDPSFTKIFILKSFQYSIILAKFLNFAYLKDNVTMCVLLSLIFMNIFLIYKQITSSERERWVPILLVVRRFEPGTAE